MKTKSNLVTFVAVLACLAAAPLPLRATPPQQTEVIIIGAGLSGLTAAHELKKAGVPYHILELGPRVGGRVRTVTYQVKGQPDIRVDSGMEEYWQSNPAVQLIKDLKLPHSESGAFSSIILQSNLNLNLESPAEFQQKIFSPAEFQSLQDFNRKVGPWIAECKPGQPLRAELLKLKDVPFSDFIERENLTDRVKNWIRISVECEMGTHWDRVSALDGLAEFSIFLGSGQRSYRVTGGNDNFTQALAKSVGLRHITLNQRVTRVAANTSAGAPEIEVQYLDTQRNRNGIIRGHQVICTIPLFRLFEVQFVPPLSARKQEAIQTMAWGSYFKAHVFVPGSAARFWTTSNALSMLPILSDSDLGVIYDGNPDQTAPTKVLSLLVHGDLAEAYNLMPLDVVRPKIVASLDKFWPGIGREVTHMEFYRYHPRAVAAWPVGRSRYDDLSNEVRKPEHGVHLAGDFTESSHSNGAVMSAQRAVRQILAARAEKDRPAHLVGPPGSTGPE